MYVWGHRGLLIHSEKKKEKSRKHHKAKKYGKLGEGISDGGWQSVYQSGQTVLEGVCIDRKRGKIKMRSKIKEQSKDHYPLLQARTVLLLTTEGLSLRKEEGKVQ